MEDDEEEEVEVEEEEGDEVDDDQYTFEAHVRSALWLSVKQEYRAFLEIKRNRNYTWEEPPTQKRVRLYGEYVHVVSSCCQGMLTPHPILLKYQTINMNVI